MRQLRRWPVAGGAVALMAAVIASATASRAAASPAAQRPDPAPQSAAAPQTPRGAPDPDGARPLSAQEMAQADAFRDKLHAWTDDMALVLPELMGQAMPEPVQLLPTLRADLDDASAADLLMLEHELSSADAYWELPAYIHALIDPDAPMPPFFAARIDEWERDGLYDAATAESLRNRPVGLVRPGRHLVKRGGMVPNAVQTPNPTPTAPFPTLPVWPTPRPTFPSGGSESRPGCPGVFKGNVCSQCGDRVPLGAIFAVHVAALIAERITDSLDPDMEDCTCTCPLPMPRPICIPFPNIPYYVANSIRIALEAIERGLVFANKLVKECEDNFRLNLVNLYLDDTVSSRVTQDSLDAHARLELQIAIERNLLRPSDERIGLFQLPQRFCSINAVPDDTTTITGFEGFRFCGQLENVRRIVSETIDRNAQAGMLIDIAGARAKLADGDMQYMAGNWKSAYERFSEAYQAAVQEESRR